MKHLSAFVLVLSLCFSSPALSQDVDCDAANDQVSMTMCADRAYQASDARLNETYQSLARSVSPEGLVALKAAQRAWITYRDAQCKFNTDGSIDGSIYPMLLAICLDALTQAQIDVLDAQLHCEEGDLSCGNQ